MKKIDYSYDSYIQQKSKALLEEYPKLKEEVTKPAHSAHNRFFKGNEKQIQQPIQTRLGFH